MNQNIFDSLTPYILSLVRMVIGYLLITHGMAKLFHMPHLSYFDGVTLFSLLGVAGALELIGGCLLLIGLLTRPTAFLLSGLCAFAYFIGHALSKGNLLLPILNGGETAVLLCFSLLLISVIGGGIFSLDHFLKKKLTK